MAYNTNNPLGSNDFRDLSDNATNFDNYANGPQPAYPNRFGAQKLSIEGQQQAFLSAQAGRQAQFEAVLASIGFSAIGDYGAGVTFTTRQQYTVRAGLAYSVANSTTLPFTLTGNWVTDEPKLKLINSDQILRSDLAQLDGSELVGTPNKAGTLSTVAAEISVLRNDIENKADTPAEIVAAVASGGKVVIKNGTHAMTAPAVCDYTGTVLFMGSTGDRYDISGETWGGTILNNNHTDYAVKLLGSFPVSQNIHGVDRFGNITISNPSYITSENTTGAGGSGLLVKTKSYTEVHNYCAVGLKLGARFDGVLTSNIRNMILVGCYQGLLHDDSNTISSPNAVNYEQVKIGGTTIDAARIDIGTALSIGNFTVEGCGTMGSLTSGLTLTMRPAALGAGNVSIRDFYSELNKGLADIRIVNESTFPVVVNISGSFFGRVSGTDFTSYNLHVTSPGGGKVTVNLNGCSFLSGLGYVPDIARPYWTLDNNCELNYDEGCSFSEYTSLPRGRGFALAKTAQFAPAGGVSSGAGGLTALKEGAGTYLVTSTSPLGHDDFGYNAHSTISGFAAQPSSTAISAKTIIISSTQFRVITLDAAGSAVDSYFTTSIFRHY